MQFKSFNLQEFEHSSGPLRKQKVQELDQICQNSGFLLLSGHGVPLKIIRAQWDIGALPRQYQHISPALCY